MNFPNKCVDPREKQAHSPGGTGCHFVNLERAGKSGERCGLPCRGQVVQCLLVLFRERCGFAEGAGRGG